MKPASKWSAALVTAAALTALAGPNAQERAGNTLKLPATVDGAGWLHARPAKPIVAIERAGQTDVSAVQGVVLEFAMPDERKNTIVQIRRLLNGQKDLKWTVPLATLQMSNGMARWRDPAPVINLEFGYKIRFKCGAETSPWSEEAAVRLAGSFAEERAGNK